MATVPDLLRLSVERYPDAVFVHHRGVDHTYYEIWRKACGLAAWLQRGGLEKGERVALLLANSVEYVVAYYGVQLAGGVVVGLNPDTTDTELAWTLNHCEAAGLIYDGRATQLAAHAAASVGSLRFLMASGGDAPNIGNGAQWTSMGEVEDEGSRVPLRSLEPTDLAQIIYTSGTSGRPKGVTLSHKNLVANTRSIVEYLRLSQLSHMTCSFSF